MEDILMEDNLNEKEDIFTKDYFDKDSLEKLKELLQSSKTQMSSLEKIINCFQNGTINGPISQNVISEIQFSILQKSEEIEEKKEHTKILGELEKRIDQILNKFFDKLNKKNEYKDEEINGCIMVLELIPSILQHLNKLEGKQGILSIKEIFFFFNLFFLFSFFFFFFCKRF